MKKRSIFSAFRALFVPWKISAHKRSKIRYAFYAILALCKPGWKLRAVHEKKPCAILFAQLRSVVGVAQQPIVIRQDEGGRNIQKLLQFQIVIIADTPLWHVDISHNQIESLAGLEGNLAVNFIDADYNRIKSISKLESCIMLVRMNLWDNPVNADEVKQLQDIGILINYNPKYVEPETES